MLQTMKAPLFLFLLLSLLTPALAQKAAPDTARETLETLLQAIEDNDLEKFESVCGDHMKEAMTEENLDLTSEKFSEVLSQGYKKVYLGEIDRLSMKTHIWKIDFKAEDLPEFSAELTVADGKVAGFYLR